MMDPLIKTVLLRTLGLLLWASLSAWLFVIVEYTGKNDREEKYQLLHSLFQSMAAKCNMSLKEFNNFSNMAYEALREPKPQWNFPSALDFVFQAVSTIGYGFITPQTPTGQILRIFVCFIGIPINMLALKAVGELIAKWINAVVRRFERKILKRSEPLENMQRKTAVILFSLMMVLIVVNSVSLMHLVGWSLVEGVYFWFVTFTTIGFGDYVPHKPQRIKELSINSSDNHGNRVKNSIIVHNTFYTFYFILCLCIVSSVLNSIMAAIEERKCRPRCSGCVPRKTRDHPDNKENNTTGQGDTDTANFEMENMATMTEGNTTSLPASKVE